MQAFPIVVYKDSESDYGTEVPDLHGCYSAGATMSEALEQTREAIYTHLAGMAKEGEVIPRASDLSDIQRSGDYADALAFAVVEIELNKVSTATERINITLPKWLISRIDASEPNRSRFLAQSAIRALQDVRGKYNDARTQLKTLFKTHNEREEPFAFVGREHILSEVFETVEAMKERPLRGSTFIVHGAPGAGKTALLMELFKASAKKKIPCIMCAEVPDESATSRLWRLLASVLTQTSEQVFRTTTHSERTLQAKANLVALKGGGSQTQGESVTPPQVGSCAEIADLPALANGKPKSPVIVCIDEIQNIQKDTKAAMFVRDLHTQSHVPVLLVCAGLSNSQQQLVEIGVSRVSSEYRISLGALEEEETLLGAQEGLKVIAKAARVNPNRLVELLGERIANESDNWPRHLTCYLRGVCKILIEQEEPSIESLDVAGTLERGRALREEYYGDRVDASKLPENVLALIYDQIRDNGLSRRACINLLDLELKSTQDVEFRDSFQGGREVFDQALRSGVLTVNQRNCEIPIPSLASFVDELVGRGRGDTDNYN